MSVTATAPPFDAPDERARFITRTYGHLLGAALAFVVLEVWFFTTGMAEAMAGAMLGTSWLWVLGAYMIVATLAAHFAHTLESRSAQYLALGTYVLAEAVLFVPLLYVAESLAPGVIGSAGVFSVAGFALLTAIGFWTRRDFSFLGPFLFWGGLVALGLIVWSILFGFGLGALFSAVMIGFAGAAILYDTSNVLHHFEPHQHVAASLELFSSFALLLWYVIRLMVERVWDA